MEKNAQIVPWGPSLHRVDRPSVASAGRVASLHIRGHGLVLCAMQGSLFQTTATQRFCTILLGIAQTALQASIARLGHLGARHALSESSPPKTLLQSVRGVLRANTNRKELRQSATSVWLERSHGPKLRPVALAETASGVPMAREIVRCAPLVISLMKRCHRTGVYAADVKATESCAKNRILCSRSWRLRRAIIESLPPLGWPRRFGSAQWNLHAWGERILAATDIATKATKAPIAMCARRSISRTRHFKNAPPAI